MTRHAVVDLAQVFGASPRVTPADRLPPAALARLRSALAFAGTPLPERGEVDDKLAQLRGQYEPYVAALSEYLLQPLPAWLYETPKRDNWQTTAWDTKDRSMSRDHF
jgi:hypothetical protein